MSASNRTQLFRILLGLVLFAALGRDGARAQQTPSLIPGYNIVTGQWDASQAARTNVSRTGTGSPVGRDQCNKPGESYFQTDATPGQNNWYCTTAGSPGTWTNGSSGTVTSVSASCLAWLTCPVATPGTTPALTIGAATGQTSHEVIGTCGSATSFAPCSLVAGDLPSIPNSSLVNSAITIGGTSVSLGGSTSSFPSPGAIGGTTPSTGLFTTLGASGLLTAGSAGAASTPGLLVSGAPYIGGTTTTNFPQLYVNDGTGPTTFSANGTEIGVNAPSGFAGNFLDFHLNGGASLASLNYLGNGTFNALTSSTSLTTGSGAATVCGSINGCIGLTEGSSAMTPTAGQDGLRGDSATHVVKATFNGSPEFQLAPIGLACISAPVTSTTTTSNVVITSFTVPGGTIQAGTAYRIEVWGTATDATSTAANTFDVNWGTSGNNTDTAIGTLSPTSAVGTSSFVWTLLVTWQSTTAVYVTGQYTSSTAVGLDSHTDRFIGPTITSGLSTSGNEILSVNFQGNADLTVSFTNACIEMVHP